MVTIIYKKNLKIKGLILLLGFALIQFSYAVEQSKGFYIGGNVDYHIYDHNLNFDNKLGFGVNVGYQLNKKWGVEYFYEYANTKDQFQNDVIVDYYHLNGVYNFDSEENEILIPFVQFGYGHVNYDIQTDPVERKEDNSVDVGVGFKYILFPTIPSIQLRPAIRLIHPVDEAFDIGISYNVGLSYLFGAPKYVPKPRPEWVEPVIEKPVVKAPEPVVVAPVIVAPKDGDKDGVLDRDDACPDSKPGAIVIPETGCEKVEFESKEFTLDVKFKTGSSVLDPTSKGSIADLAKFLVEFPETNVVIEGHTDSMGSAASNKVLSQKRADSVRISLTSEFGTEASRVTSVGYGKEQPIADNATEAGRALNRRVVAKVKSKPRMIKK